MRKAFDSVNHSCLFNKIASCGIFGKLYWSLKSLYSGPLAAVQINEHITDWFPVKAGLRQGDSLSTTLFALFINDLALELKQTNCGVSIAGDLINCLFYADDIVILAETERDLQKMLHVIHNWTKKWRLLINFDKTKIVHFRTPSTKRSEFVFTCGGHRVCFAEKYPYLGCELNEYLDFTYTATVLANAAGRAVGSLVSKHKQCH